MKDSLHLANMLRRFTREKEEMRKKNLAAAGLPRPNAKVPTTNSTLLNAHPKATGSGECNMGDLTDDQAVMSILGSANNDILQDMMGDLDFTMLDSPQPSSPAQGENGSFGMGHKAGVVRASQGNIMTPPPLPSGLPDPLMKRIEDLRAVCTSFSLRVQFQSLHAMNPVHCTIDDFTELSVGSGLTGGGFSIVSFFKMAYFLLVFFHVIYVQPHRMKV